VSMYDKPLPVPDEDTKEFWDGCRRHKLLVQRCPQCGYYCFPPYPMCPKCQSVERCWVEVSGRGKVYSWAIVHRPAHPAFTKDAPYALVLIELNEQQDLRMLGNIVDCDIADIRADMPVEVLFDDVTEEITLPKWKLVR